MIRKRHVLKYFGTLKEAADFLNISVQSVSDWPDPVPRQIALELFLRLPHVFEPPPPDQLRRRQRKAA